MDMAKRKKGKVKLWGIYTPTTWIFSTGPYIRRYKTLNVVIF